MSRTGVLLLGFGGPESIDSVRPFMCNLMDREPSDELVDSVCMRYLAIGGGSPLPQIAQSIAEGLEERLGQEGKPAPVRVGMRYWNPFIADAVAELMELGCDRIVTYSLSPFESKAASGAYREAIDAVVAEHGHLEIVEAPLLSSSEDFVDYFAGSAAIAIEDIEPSEGAIVVFTAHSLPVADLVENDPYVQGLENTAQAIAEKLGMALGYPGAGAQTLEGFTALGSTDKPRAWFLAYQSVGARPGGWLGPQLEDLIPAVAKSAYSAIVVVPIGFTTDHMETLYDLDIVAASAALDADLEFMRAAVPNDDPRILEAITKLVAPLI
jgi:ferrochelatase